MLAPHGTSRGKQRGLLLPRARWRQLREPRSAIAAPCRDTARFPASKIDALATDLVHQWRAFAVGAGPERPRLHKYPAIGKYIGAEISQAAKLVPAVGKVFQEYRDIVVG